MRDIYDEKLTDVLLNIFVMYITITQFGYFGKNGKRETRKVNMPLWYGSNR